MKSLIKGAQEYLRGIAQAFFLERALFGFGLLFTIGAFDPHAFALAFFGSLVGFLHSSRHSTPKLIRHFGLMTINGFFFGLAMAHYFEPTPAFYLMVLAGSVVLPYVLKACFEVLQHWKLGVFILPYILTIWLIWMSGAGLSLSMNPHTWPVEYSTLPGLNPDWEPVRRLIDAVFLSAGRLLFIPNANFGIAIVLLVLIFNLRRGIYYLLGTALAVGISYLLSRGPGGWEYGHFTYCAGLTGLGLASLPDRVSWRSITGYCLLSFLITLASARALSQLDLPVLSLPYVLTLWLALLSRVPRVNISWAPVFNPSTRTGTVFSAPNAETKLRRGEQRKAA